MKSAQLKPWSHVEDDAAEVSGVPAERVSSPAITVASSAPRPWKPSFLPAMPSVVWSIAPLGLGVTWALIMASTAPMSKGLAWFHAMGILVCNGIAAVMLVAGRAARRRALTDLRHAVAQGKPLTSSAVASTIPPESELTSFWEAIEQHSRNVEQRVRELLEDRKEITLELGLAEVRRRQAEAILFGISDPILVVDAFDQLVFSNPAAEELFGFSNEAAHRKPISELIADVKLVSAIQQVRDADSRVARRRIDHEIEQQVFSLSMSPVVAKREDSEDASEKHGVVVTMRDITKEREASKMKSEFVAHVSHELRTPLASIRAYVEMLVDGEAADEQTRSEYYEIIQTSADRLGRLIDNMLNISRIEAGTVRINKEPVAISMIVKEVADVIRPQADEKDIKLTEDLSPVVDRVMADKDLINEAVTNLLSNAVKYTPPGGKVHVRMSTQDENRRIRIDVSDTGAGIPQEDLPRVFQKFFRVEANNKMAKGTGLGLNLVKKIIETVHGGELTLTSEVGKGSTFSILLPLVAQ